MANNPKMRAKNVGSSRLADWVKEAVERAEATSVERARTLSRTSECQGGRRG